MRKHIWLIGILVVAMLAVTLMAGCGKKQSVVSTSGSTAGTPAPSGPAGSLADLIKKQSGLTSYIMIMDAGQTKMRMAAKLEGGKSVRMKIDMGQQGWVLIQIDKKMQYTYNPITKSAMAMPISDSAVADSERKDLVEQLKAVADAKVSSDTIDGIDCLKVVSAKVTMWCNKATGLPVQTEAAGQKTKFKYEQINSVPDSEFEVPAGIKIQQMPNMPNMPKMPK